MSACLAFNSRPDQIWFFIFYEHIKYNILKMLKRKRVFNQNIFYSLEVVDRVSEAQL